MDASCWLFLNDFYYHARIQEHQEIHKRASKIQPPPPVELSFDGSNNVFFSSYVLKRIKKFCKSFPWSKGFSVPNRTKRHKHASVIEGRSHNKPFNFGTRFRWMIWLEVRVALPPCAELRQRLARKLCGAQIRSGCRGSREKFLSLPQIEIRSSDIPNRRMY